MTTTTSDTSALAARPTATAAARRGGQSAGTLRFATAGSVDDGKSTLVGRLLHDTKTILADQMEAVERVSRERGLDGADLALLTDGLRAEREQGITIDVAYRYFATPRRRFILADTPGHVQYTRNMVTGASTAQLAVVLVDARHGVVEQTRRHIAIAALLRVPHVVLAVNKMDLVDYRESVFAPITAEFARYARALGLPGVTAIPVSALTGDNVVDRSSSMDWYGGPTLLEHLETVEVAPQSQHAATRLPVQCVIRPRSPELRDYRGYAGQLTSGTLRVGDVVTVRPSGRTTTVTDIELLGVPVEIARAPQSVTVRLGDDLDISRGEMICAGTPVEPTREVRAAAAHLHERPLRVGDRVLLKYATSTVRAVVKQIPTLTGITSLTPDGRPIQIPEPGMLRCNDIGTIVVRTADPVTLDDYRAHRHTGSFLLIDPADGATLTAGMNGPAFT